MAPLVKGGSLDVQVATFHNGHQTLLIAQPGLHDSVHPPCLKTGRSRDIRQNTHFDARLAQ